MQLRELLDAAGVEAEVRGGDPEIASLDYDSRRVGRGGLFFCFRGLTSDGHDHAEDALARGASALVVERWLELDAPQARVADARVVMAPVAAEFWGDPTAEMSVVGITGTNGKTTTAFLARELLEASGRNCGLLGTVKRVVGGVEEEVERTTPEAIDLQATFRRMRDAGDEACAMEVSSHALALHRADAIHFEARVFMNLTQDHLDFHSDMEDYFAAKRLLFERDGGTAVVNVDDQFGARLAGELHARRGEGVEPALVTFSPGGSQADFSARSVGFDSSGAAFRAETPGGSVDVRIPLPGDFNVENALAALAAAYALGVEPDAAAQALAGAGRVPGRFEPVDEGQPFTVLVDYAHTPDSLENALQAARRLTSGRLIAVFGCGGDRDREKRPLMGRIGAELSDLAVVTSDNPRSEDPDLIITEILAGIAGTEDRATEGLEVEPDRRAAIALALARAGEGDAVVIAGKGHEQGQEFERGRKVPFDDREVAREELRRLAAKAPAPGS
jgi:UDP-N-acetylmuramoyl-L-alanyl-D-glutamate--2,6-diaminopimelate ligase